MPKKIILTTTALLAMAISSQIAQAATDRAGHLRDYIGAYNFQIEIEGINAGK